MALGFLAANGFRALESLLLRDGFSAFPWAALLVWAPVWAYHWRAITRDGPESTRETLGIRRLYLYLAAGLGLVMLASGFGRLVSFTLQEGYWAAFASDVIATSHAGLWREAVRSSLAVTVVGGVVWWTHWLGFAATDRGSALRWVWLTLATVGGGAVTALVGFGMILQALLSWLTGAATDPAATHFSLMSVAVGTSAAGVVLWRYFRRRMVVESAGHAVPHVARTYDLLLAAIGLVTLAVASATILDTFLRLIADTAPTVVDGDTQWRFRLSLTLTLLAIGVPIWWTHWRRIQSAASADPATEGAALPRRLYLLGVLSLGLLALAGSAGSTLFLFLRDLLDSELSAATLRDLATSLAIALTALAAIPSHWAIYRRDRELDVDTPPAPARKRVTLLSAAGGSALRDRVEEALGYPVTAVPWPDADAFVPALDGDELARVREAVAAAEGAHVLLIPEPATLRVVSHD